MYQNEAELNNQIEDLQTRVINPKLNQIRGMIEVVSSEPTGTPNTLNGQLKLYINSTTYRLYIYDPVNAAWRYASLT